MIDFFIILAVWRMTSLLANENGPFDIFKNFRLLYEHEQYIDPFCFWCISVWMGFVFALIFGKDIVIFALAYSAGAIIIEEILDRIKGI